MKLCFSTFSKVLLLCKLHTITQEQFIRAVFSSIPKFYDVTLVGNESNYEKLKYNIDPSDTSDCYVSKKYAVTRQDAFKDPDKKYRIHEKDKATVKKYQK
jgi:hypothetical protein